MQLDSINLQSAIWNNDRYSNLYTFGGKFFIIFYLILSFKLYFYFFLKYQDKLHITDLDSLCDHKQAKDTQRCGQNKVYSIQVKIMRLLVKNLNCLCISIFLIRKLTRATLVLFPLFGLTFAVCFYLPTDPTTLFAKIYYFVNVFLQTTQGVWVAFVYCFLNDEVKKKIKLFSSNYFAYFKNFFKVKNAIKTKLRSWKISRLKISRLISLTNTATRNHSFPTIYSTQITSNHSSITRNRQDTTINPNDPSRLPILQEDKV